MKALVKSRPEPGIWMESAPVPTPGPEEVLIKIQKTAICGTDLHIVKWDDFAARYIQPPRIIGHEFVGEIAEIGKEVTGYALGDRVTGEGHITCGTCRNCRAGKTHLCPNTKGIGGAIDGAFAEYLVMPVSNLWRIHPEVSSDLASIHDPLGNAVHTALSFDLVAKDILITGAGPIGIMAAKVCQFSGAHHVVLTDVNDYRLKLAKKMGIEHSINVSSKPITEVMNKLSITDGFDVGLEMSGNPVAFNDMISNMYPGGHIALLGFLPLSTDVNWDDVIFKGITIKGIYGREMYETWVSMTRLLHSGLDVEKIITHHFHIDDYEEAFRVGLEGQCGKIILNWD